MRSKEKKATSDPLIKAEQANKNISRKKPPVSPQLMNETNNNEPDAVSKVKILVKEDHRVMIRMGDHHRRAVLHWYLMLMKYRYTNLQEEVLRRVRLAWNLCDPEF